jgi:hypothetical protein
MPHPTARRAAVGIVAAAVGAGALPASAAAAAIVTKACSTAIKPSGGQRLGPETAVAGAGFVPSSPVSFAWNNGGGSGGTLNAGPTGTFNARILPPRSIFASKRHVRPYALTATSTADRTATATRKLKVVRFDTVVSTRNGKHPHPRDPITYRLYGYPRKAPVYAHYTFGGNNVGTLRFGPAKGACGLLRQRTRVLPAGVPVHFGTYHIYLTNHKGLPHSPARRRAQTLDSFTYKHIVVHTSAVAAASGPAEDGLTRVGRGR